METHWLPAKNIVLNWFQTVTTRLFPDKFHSLFDPKKILIPLEQHNRLQILRAEYREQIDSLIDNVLSCPTTEDIEKLLSETDPTTVALYYDRVVFGTWYLDNMLPVEQNRSCEIPQDWAEFVSLLLHQKWFV